MSETDKKPMKDYEADISLKGQNDSVIDGYIDKLLNGTASEKKATQDAIAAYYQSYIKGLSRVKFGGKTDRVDEAVLAATEALYKATARFDTGKVKNGLRENYFKRTISTAIAGYLEDVRIGSFPKDVTKVDSAVKKTFVNGETVNEMSVKGLILEKKIRTSGKFAEKLAKEYLQWRHSPECITAGENPESDVYSSCGFPTRSYLEVKKQIKSISGDSDFSMLGLMDEGELENTAQRLSVDYKELLYLRDRFPSEKGDCEISDLSAFLLSAASCGDLIDYLMKDNEFREQFEREYNEKFGMDDFSLDTIGVPYDQHSSDRHKAFTDEYNYIRQFIYVPAFKNNYLNARKKLSGNMIRSKLSSKNVRAPIDFAVQKSFVSSFAFTDFNDAEEEFILKYLRAALNDGSNDINANTYLSMLLFFKLLEGYEGEQLNICNSDGTHLTVTTATLLKYAENSFYADYSTGSVGGYLGAMIYALSSELFSVGPVKSRLFLVKQIFEQFDSNGIAHDAYSYIEADLYDLYFAVSRLIRERRFTFSDYVEERAMRYDILQVWDDSDDSSLGKLVTSERKKAKKDEFGEAYQRYKDSLLLLMDNSKLKNGRASGSMLSFNLLMLDLAFPFRPLSNVVKACFREPEFRPMWTYYDERADYLGITLGSNQNMAFVYCMQNDTRYLRRLAVSLVVHHCIDDVVIENYRKIIETEQ